MKYIYSVLISLFLLGCSTKDIDDVLAAAAGNKPPQFFKFTSPAKVEKWYFETKDYKALPPKTYQKDWKLMSPWHGAYIYGGIAFGNGNKDENQVGLYLGYGINMTSSVTMYGDRERAFDVGDEKYLKNIRIIKSSNGETTNLNLHLEYHGKENYPCEVGESINKLRGNRDKFYICYKFNPKRTMAKSVTIIFIYTKSPNLPKKYQPLAKEYTYEDLLKRSQRVLDSLYIKDGWDE
jgi:hypothetical protein